MENFSEYERDIVEQLLSGGLEYFGTGEMLLLNHFLCSVKPDILSEWFEENSINLQGAGIQKCMDMLGEMGIAGAGGIERLLELGLPSRLEQKARDILRSIVDRACAEGKGETAGRDKELINVWSGLLACQEDVVLARKRRDELDAMTAGKQALEKEIAGLEKKIADLDRLMRDKSVTPETRDRLGHDLANSKKEFRRLEKEIKRLERNNASVQRDIKEGSKRREDLKAEKENLESQKSELDSEVSELKQIVGPLRNEVEGLRKEKKGLEQERKRLEDEAGEIRALKESIKRLEAELRNSESVIAGLERQKDALEQDLAGQTEKTNALKEEVAGLEEEKSRLLAEQKKAAAGKRKLESEISDIERQIKNDRDRTEEMEKRIRSEKKRQKEIDGLAKERERQLTEIEHEISLLRQNAEEYKRLFENLDIEGYGSKLGEMASELRGMLERFAVSMNSARAGES